MEDGFQSLRFWTRVESVVREAAKDEVRGDEGNEDKAAVFDGGWETEIVGFLEGKLGTKKVGGCIVVSSKIVEVSDTLRGRIDGERMGRCLNVIEERFTSFQCSAVETYFEADVGKLVDNVVLSCGLAIVCQSTVFEAFKKYVSNYVDTLDRDGLPDSGFSVHQECHFGNEVLSTM